MELVEQMLGSDQLALARLITLVEREASETPQIIKSIYPHTGKSYVVGVTGPPGGGKSTLIDRLTAVLRRKGLTVGIVAVDPTSPFSGGAMLGDRIRMQQHYLDSGVFIRSMATRGSQGGLPRTVRGVIKLLDAAGKDIILVETVGVGQTELDIMEAVDTIVVVLVPEAGDTIQTLKAGLMEIGDVFVVNKADRGGAENLVAELEAMLHQNLKQTWWEVPALTAQAANDIGIEELYERIESHHQALQQMGKLDLKRCEQRKKELTNMIGTKITSKFSELINEGGEFTRYLEIVERGELDPYSVWEEIIYDRVLLRTWMRRLEEEIR